MQFLYTLFYKWCLPLKMRGSSNHFAQYHFKPDHAVIFQIKLLSLILKNIYVA